jgi:hypothetical protein
MPPNADRPIIGTPDTSIMELLYTISGVVLALCFLYGRVKFVARQIADIRRDKATRVTYFALLVAILLMIGSCNIVERVTGVSPNAIPPSFAVRRSVGAVFLVLFVAFSWWYEARERRKRNRAA